MLESFEDGRLSGCVGKIQNLSSSVGFITRTLEGRVDFKDNIYFRKETIEDNISSGIIDLRQTGLNHVTDWFSARSKQEKPKMLIDLRSQMFYIPNLVVNCFLPT